MSAADISSPPSPGPVTYAGGFATLTMEGMHALIETLHAAGVRYAECRGILMAGLPNDLVAHLPTLPAPRDQLLSDMQLLNEMGAADSDSRPLVVWLSSVQSRTKFHERASHHIRRLLAALQESESEETSVIRRSRDIAHALAGFGGEAGGIIRVCAGFSSLGIPPVHRHYNPEIADALQDERRAFHTLLRTGRVTLRAILNPGMWKVDEAPTDDAISRRQRWLAYCLELQRVLRAAVGASEVSGEDHRAFMGWKLDVVYSNDLADHNLLLLDERVCFRGIRLRRGGGYVRTRQTRDRALLDEEVRDFDLLFDSALHRLAARCQAETRAAALVQARRDMIRRLGEQADQVDRWLTAHDPSRRADTPA